jgi:hypothetical protein
MITQVGRDHQMVFREALGNGLPIVGKAKKSVQDEDWIAGAEFTGVEGMGH